MLHPSSNDPLQKAFIGKRFSGTRLELTLKPKSASALADPGVGCQFRRRVRACGYHAPRIMGLDSATAIACRARMNMTVSDKHEIDVPRAMPCDASWHGIRSLPIRRSRKCRSANFSVCQPSLHEKLRSPLLRLSDSSVRLLRGLPPDTEGAGWWRERDAPSANYLKIQTLESSSETSLPPSSHSA